MSARDVLAELGVKVHPAADQYPMVADSELDALACDLAETGLQMPVFWIKTSDGNQLLDGRSRIVAVARISDQKRKEALEKALQKNFVILPCFVDARQRVASLNLHRLEQRRACAAFAPRFWQSSAAA